MAEKTVEVPKVPESLSLLHLEELFGTARSINFFKTKISKRYQKWNNKSAETIELLKYIENSLENYSKATDVANIVGEASSIIGTIASLCGIFLLNDEKMAETFKRVGKCFTVAGSVTVKGSTILNKQLTKNGCNSAERTLDELKTLTEELESERIDYFRLVKKFETILNEINEDDRKFLYYHLEENQLGNVMKYVRLDDSVINDIPPIRREMDGLKIREDVLDRKFFEFNLIPKISEEIKNDPIMKEILSMKCKYVPCISGENAIKGVQAVSNLKSMMSVVDLIPIDKMHKFNNSEFINGLSNISLLIDSIINLFFLISSRSEASAQCEEVKRIANELEEYRSYVKDILRESLQWHFVEDDLVSIEDGNRLKSD